MEEPKIAAKEPAAVELEEGKNIFSVRVVNPPTNHFVMEPIQERLSALGFHGRKNR